MRIVKKVNLTSLFTFMQEEIFSFLIEIVFDRKVNE